MGLQPRRHLSRLSVLATAALAASAVMIGGLAQAASAAPGGAPAAQGVTSAVPAAAQTAARSFWTTARMDSATPLVQAAPGNTTAATPQPPPGIPNPVYFNGVPTVGALFFTEGSTQVEHFCTASVIDSATFNLILTAAHCVYDTVPVANMAYVPEWHLGVSPYGTWPVESVTVAQGWEQSQDPNLDFAFLQVAPPSGTNRPVQAVTGGLQLGIDTGYNHHVNVIGYNNTDSQPIVCASTSFEFEPSQEQFYCNNYQDGTSGGPWIVDYNPVTGTGIDIGDIGGYQQGGDYPWTSYSPYYSASILKLFVQAQLQQV